MEIELQRSRADVQTRAQVLLAEGVRLFMLDDMDQAVCIFERGIQIAEKAGVKNAYVFPLRPWLASALRRQVEKAAGGDVEVRPTQLNRAMKVAQQALRTARRFQNDLPHSLRVCGLIAALQRHAQQAREYLNESLAIAEQQGARFEHAQSLLARGQVGKQYGWPEAHQDLTSARQALHTMGADFALDVAT